MFSGFRVAQNWYYNFFLPARNCTSSGILSTGVIFSISVGREKVLFTPTYQSTLVFATVCDGDLAVHAPATSPLRTPFRGRRHVIRKRFIRALRRAVPVLRTCRSAENGQQQRSTGKCEWREVFFFPSASALLSRFRLGGTRKLRTGCVFHCACRKN